MEKKFEKVWELLKEWHDLGLITTEPSELSINITRYGKGWSVEIPELGAFEDGATVHECLDAHIRELQHDYDYRKAKCEHEQIEKGIQKMKEANWF